jgi:hypothetical protein
MTTLNYGEQIGMTITIAGRGLSLGDVAAVTRGDAVLMADDEVGGGFGSSDSCLAGMSGSAVAGNDARLFALFCACNTKAA